MREKRLRGNEQGSAIIMAILVTLLLLLLGVALLGMSGSEGLIAANDQWSEGAFQAAEAAVQESIDRLNIGSTNLVVAATEIGDRYSFYSGGRDDTSPQPPTLIGTSPGSGYALGESTGYNPEGYHFAVYQLQGTGTGPRDIVREVEVQVEIGPIAQ